MGILEINQDSVHYVRTNQSYRDLLKRVFNIDISGSQTALTVSSDKFNPFFMEKLRECSETGKHIMIDERLKDGTVIHSFARKISVNSTTGATAIAVAVLSLSGFEEGTTYAEIARALAMDYFYIYYVNLDTEKFIEYSRPSDKEELAIERHGDKFFETALNDAKTRIYELDREAFIHAFTKENIIQTLEKQGAFTLTYRLIHSGKPIYMSMKVTRLHTGGNRLIIGVSVIDSQMKQQEILNRIQKEQDTMMRVIALTDGYLALYTIDPKSDHYIEYTASKEYESLGYSKMGTDFFLQGIIDGKRTVWKKDLAEYLEKFSKEQVMEDIRNNGKYKLSYNLVIDGTPKPVTLVIVPFKDGEDEMLLAGVKEEKCP